MRAVRMSPMSRRRAVDDVGDQRRAANFGSRRRAAVDARKHRPGKSRRAMPTKAISIRLDKGFAG